MPEPEPAGVPEAATVAVVAAPAETAALPASPSTPTTLTTPTPPDPVAPGPPITPAAAPPSGGPVADAPPSRAHTAPARGFWVQLGAFRAREGAASFQQRVATELDWLAPLLAVFDDNALFRLQAGPYPARSDARAAAERIRDGLRLVPVIVERR